MDCWKSPIEIKMQQVYENLIEQEDQYVLNCVNRVLVDNIDVPRLKDALEYGRKSFDEGYIAGFNAAKKAIIKELTEVFDYDYWLNDVVSSIQEVEPSCIYFEEPQNEDYDVGFDPFIGSFTDEV